jgi:hypothetical protein
MKNIENIIRNQIYHRTYWQVWRHIDDQIDNQARGQIFLQVWNQVETQICWLVIDQISEVKL